MTEPKVSKKGKQKANKSNQCNAEVVFIPVDESGLSSKTMGLFFS